MKKSIVTLSVALLVAVAAAAPPGAQEKPRHKVLVSVDMEGIWGVVNGDQTSSDGRDYGAARKWMAEDVNAVVAGLFEAGATVYAIRVNGREMPELGINAALAVQGRPPFVLNE